MATDPPFNIVKAFDRMLKRKYLTKETNDMSKERDFKVGDIIKVKSPLQTWWYQGRVLESHEGNAFPYKIEVTSTNHPMGKCKEYWVDKNQNIELIGETQLELDLTGEDESLRLGDPKFTLDPMYCNCCSPSLKTNSAYGNVFQVCTKCKKEYI